MVSSIAPSFDLQLGSHSKCGPLPANWRRGDFSQQRRPLQAVPLSACRHDAVSSPLGSSDPCHQSFLLLHVAFFFRTRRLRLLRFLCPCPLKLLRVTTSRLRLACRCEKEKKIQEKRQEQKEAMKTTPHIHLTVAPRILPVCLRIMHI